MSDYWKDFIPAMRATRLGNCIDSDPELNAAWIGWQARDAEIERLKALINRVLEWTPAFPVEASLLDDLADAVRSPSSAGDKS